jgi:hypothetical protein
MNSVTYFDTLFPGIPCSPTSAPFVALGRPPWFTREIGAAFSGILLLTGVGRKISDRATGDQESCS